MPESDIYKHYDVLVEIGTGGFSRVYKASPLEDEKKFVAIKVVRSRENDCELRDVAENEVRVMEAVRELVEYRDNFVQIVEVFREPRRISMVMEYLDGGELFDRVIQRQKYSEVDAANAMKTIIKALDAMHKRGIVHRDIKPENLVYLSKDSDESLKIMDFGLAYFIGEKDPHQSAVYVGTPGYIAPEVILSAEYAPAADIWSMGVILYILLSGRMPFAGRTSSVMQTRVITGTFHMKGVVWDNISKSAKNLIKKMLAVDVKKRITAEEILKHSWFREANMWAMSKNLMVTVQRLRDFKERKKMGEEIQMALKQAGDGLRDKMWNLIKKSNPTGLTAEDIQKVKRAFVDDDNEFQNPEISRSVFTETLKRIGLKKLPLDDIFDAIVFENEKKKLEDIKGISLTTSNKEITQLKNDVKRRNSTIKLDELLVGLSTVAAIESTETFLRFLFNLFTPGPTDKEEKNLKSKFLNKQGFAKIAKVLASYRKDSSDRRNFLAEQIGKLFSFAPNDDEDEDEELVSRETSVASHLVSFEEFNAGVSKLGKDLFEEYLHPHLKNLALKIENYGTNEHGAVRRTVDYMKRVGSIIEDVQEKWSMKKVNRKDSKSEEDKSQDLGL